MLLHMAHLLPYHPVLDRYPVQGDLLGYGILVSRLRQRLGKDCPGLCLFQIGHPYTR